MAQEKKKDIEKKVYGVVDNSIGKYDDDPFFARKTKENMEYLKKVGFPKHLTKEQLGL